MTNRAHLPLIGLVGLLAFIVAAVSLGRGATPIGPNAEHGSADIARDLQFTDAADGSIIVTEVPTGRQIAELEPGSNGFIRATLRGLARERRQAEQGEEVPFRISVWIDGRVVLTDTATGRVVELLAFGTSNAAAFSRLLRN